MKHFLSITSILFFVFLFCSCKDTTLNKEMAAEMLDNYIPAQQLMEKADMWDEYDILEGYQYLTWDEKKWDNGFSKGTKRHNFILRGEAKNHLYKQRIHGRKDRPEYIFIVGSKDFGYVNEVTRVKGSNTAFVDYVVLDSISDFGERIFGKMNKKYVKRATFVLYEEGWSIEKLEQE